MVASVATVLLVDDERQVTQGLEAILHREPYQVLTAHSAQEALALLRRRPVDVVVSDERMPAMNGSAFLAIVAKELPDTARILLTGYATLEAALAAINEGRICRLLQKPCKPADLRAAIAEAIHQVASSRTAAHASPARRNGFSDDEMARLSDREREVFGLLVDGLRISQAAKALFVSEHTVRNHLKAIFHKLDVHSQAELLGKGRGLRTP